METNSTNNDSAEIMSPEQWMKHTYEDFPSTPRLSIVMTKYAEYYHSMNQKQVTTPVWRRASEGFPVEGKPESLIGKHLRWAATEESFMISHFNALRYYINGEGKSRHINDCVDNIEWLDESGSRPEIKLPDPWSHEIDYTLYKQGYNDCIKKTKRLNGIK